jgi:hypothetical protein
MMMIIMMMVVVVVVVVVVEDDDDDDDDDDLWYTYLSKLPTATACPLGLQQATVNSFSVSSRL